MPNQTPMVLTDELRAALKKIEESSGAEIDDPAFAAQLRKGAEEHAEILRRSRELGNKRVYRTGGW